MQLVSRTIYNSLLQTTLLMRTKFEMAENTTLNELLGIQNGILPTNTPGLGYLAIGNGGHKVTLGANGIPLTNPIQHEATDAAPFNILPFVLRAIDNDIDALTQANYALRRIETHDGAQYIAYYLKRMNLASLMPKMVNISTANNITTTTDFVPTSANLNPVPKDLTNTGVNLVSGDYVAASAAVSISLSATEVSELLDVANIIYGDPAYAIISEIALCSGEDKLVQSPSANNASINFKEAVAVQVLSFVSAHFPLQFNTAGVDMNLNCGASEPTYNLV